MRYQRSILVGALGPSLRPLSRIAGRRKAKHHAEAVMAELRPEAEGNSVAAVRPSAFGGGVTSTDGGNYEKRTYHETGPRNGRGFRRY